MKRYLEHIGQGHVWKSGPTPEPFWDFYKDWGWTGDQFVELCNAGADAGFIFCGPTRPGAAQVVQSIKDAGHEVIIITDRQFGSTPSVSHNNTREWLAEHLIPYDELHFSADKTIVKTDYFVEDKLENYDNLTLAGTTAFLIDRPWNQVGVDARRRIKDIRYYPIMVELARLERESAPVLR